MKRIAISIIASTLTASAFASRSAELYHIRYVHEATKSIRGGASASEISNDEADTSSPLDKDSSSVITPGVDMPTLFNLNIAEECMYDKYAACLAATEGLQRYRDYEIVNPHNKKLKKMFGFGKEPSNEQIEKTANARYIVNSSKIIRSFGLSIPLFSRLGREINNDPDLKNRIKEQAYLYRMAATVTMPRKPILANTDKNTIPSSKSKPSHITSTTTTATTTTNVKNKKYQTFAKTLKEMEYTRQEQIDRLCKAMNIDSLPHSSSMLYNDEKVMKILHPKVKAVYEAFPHQAEEIIRQNGLNVDDFNCMLREMKSNPIVKWKIDQCLKRELN